MIINYLEDLVSMTAAGSHELARDLDFQDDSCYSNLSNKTTWTSGTGWSGAAGGGDFTGTFDGKGYKIKNLYINRTSGVLDGANYSLFNRAINSAQFSNLILEDFNITVINSTYCYTGCLVGGETSNAVIDNVHVINASLNGVIVGGIVGWHAGNTVIQNCSFDGDIVCNNGQYREAGGIVAELSTGEGLITNGTGTIQKCKSTGTITMSALGSGDSGAGGIVARVWQNRGMVEDCYSEMTVPNLSNCALIVGYGGGTGFTIRKCWTNKAVGSYTMLRGGSATFAGNRFDTTTTGLSSSTGATATSTADMKSLVIFVMENWSIVPISQMLVGTPTTWFIDENNDYPRLEFEYVAPVGIKPTIITDTAPSGKYGVPYSFQMEAEGTAPITWTKQVIDETPKPLPTGLDISSEGLISGTPSAMGTFPSYVRAVNDYGEDFEMLYIVIGKGIPIIQNVSFPNAILGNPAYYLQQLLADGVTPITWSKVAGDLPSGMYLITGSTSYLEGNPTVSGTFTFTLRATNSAGYAEKEFSLMVVNKPTITTASLPNGTVNETYSQVLTATGYPQPIFSIDSGSLPTGLSLSGDTITGTPTALGTFTFTVKASNVGADVTKQLSITINSLATPPTITSITFPNGIVGTAYNQYLQATGDTPITWTILSGSLPAGLSLNATAGQISGTPSVADVSTFIIQASNDGGNDIKPITITINAVGNIPSISTATFPNGKTSAPYSQQLTAIGDTPITWTIDSGSLPTGLTLAGDTISGTPSAAGTFNFTVKATNAAGAATKQLAIVIVSTGYAGNGTEPFPYLIYTAAELAQLATYVNAGTAPYANAGIYYKLMNDIDLSDYGATWNGGAGWIPIGNNNTEANLSIFRGNFDGNGYIISNLYIDKINNTNKVNATGLFGWAINSKINNIGIDNCNIQVNATFTGNSAQYAAALCARLEGGSISNSYATGLVKHVVNTQGGCETGSIVSYTNITNGNSNILNCWSACEVIGITAGTYSYVYGIGRGTNVSNCTYIGKNISVSGSTVNKGRITISSSSTPINNIAYNDVMLDNIQIDWSPKGLNTINGEDITKQQINSDGTLGGRFIAPIWTTKNGKLPGLFGRTVDMPEHLKLSKKQRRGSSAVALLL